MEDADKTQAQLIEELQALRGEVAALCTKSAAENRAEGALYEKDLYLQSIYENSNRRLVDSQRAAKVGNYEWDLLTGEVSWSAEMHNIFEVDEDYVPTTEGFAEFVHPDDMYILSKESFQKALSDRHHEFEFRVIGARSQEVKSIHLWGKVDTNAEGTPIQIYGTLQDITARKAVELALRESEERYRLLVENASVCIHEIDLEGRLVSMNRTGLDMMDIADESSICGVPYLDLVAAEDRQRIETLLHSALAGQSSHFQFRAASEAPFFVDSSFIPIQDDSGDWVKIMGVSQDITDRQQMEEELRKQQNLESLGVLAGGIAHDFNNVLTGVIGGLGLLEMMLDKSSKEYGITKDSLAAAERTRDLTRQLLTFAKGGTPVKENASIEELIKETTELSLHGSNTKHEYHFSQQLHLVYMDKGQIGQVIQNIVLNSDQAMPKGGSLKVSAENVVIATEDLLPLEAGNYIKISVADEGIGMSEEVMARIFDPYYTTKEAGHGLGLSITHSIIQKHGGHIGVQSEVGIGTVFEIYLPAVHEQKEDVVVENRGLPRGTGRVLLMDDEEIIHDTITSILERLGYDVECVYDGEAALRVYGHALRGRHPYSAVILDLTIPGAMGGRETVGKLHEIDPDARVIVSSGYAHDPVMAHYKEHGFVGAVAKPVDIRELAEMVKKATAVV